MALDDRKTIDERDCTVCSRIHPCERPAFRATLDARLHMLERTRELLDGCIGCGCLSLDKCRLYNPDDKLADEGPGARRLALAPEIVD